MHPLVRPVRHGAASSFVTARAFVRVLARPLDVARSARHPDVARVFRPWVRETRRAVVRGVAGTATVAVVLHRLAPRLLRPATGALALAVAAERWRTSAPRARLHHWPPGVRSTTPLAMVDPGAFTDRARRHGPIFAANMGAEPVACVMGTSRGAALLREHADAVAHWSYPYFRFVPGGFFRSKRGPEHKQDRAVITAGLSHRLLESLAPRLRDDFDAMFHEMAAETGGASPFAWLDRTMFRVWQGVFFGLELGTDDAAALATHYAVARRAGGGASDDEAEAALQAIETAIRSSLRPALDRGAAPVCLLTEVLRREPGALDDAHLLRSLIYLSATSTWDMVGLLTWLCKHMADEPQWLETLHAEPPGEGAQADPGPRSTADHIVSETLRLAQSEFVRVRIERDIRFEGHVLPAGWVLRACVAENHRDPAVFDEPDAYRPDRWVQRRSPRSEYAPFGLDDHSCLGEALTRTTARVFLHALAAYDLHVVDDGPRQFGSRWHFAPNTRFRVALTARPAPTDAQAR